MSTTSTDVRFLDRTTPPHISTLVIMTGVSALTMSVFLPSLPEMAQYFGVEYRLMQLSVALFLAMNALLQLAIGPISDRFGRRPVLLWGFGLFIVATLGCIFAPTAHVFLAFRMAQASIVVAMALSRAVVRDMYGQAQSASVIGYVTMGMSIVPMLGPAIGGLLDRFFGWQSSFWLLAILGAVVMALIWADLGETSTTRGKPFREQLRDYPQLFSSPRFWGYNAAAACASGAFFAYLGGGPYVGSEVFGLSPTLLGLALGAPAVGYFFGNFISGRYSMSVGVDRMVLRGTLLVSGGLALSLVVFGLGLGNAGTFFALMTFVGLGNGMVIPNATAGMLSVRPQLAGTASGLGGALMIGGGAALSALAGAMLTPGSGPMTLLVIMLCSSLASVASILLVIARARQVRGRPE
jgi:DHA1 family bicyclomycin/chloramphenicol resistance-like MFS transporter